ncbi:biotin/lipoyl-containing protein [Rhizorhabdus wittichii]|uniref:Biotin/lipoyl attachment domain-containing protein n=2 Tax=Rhizorhabdus wittichii TaxID=160791 RepID=A0A9J9H924_RHIWR|nr:lipoyl domain-containing protein [Rhizorhabdus wittichii]ABQ67208.1 biotin/lipoyl attachment domain-containing protein [Rhizorhabdus wittichii RW1]ARR56019.1 dihydrolipoamide acyltransferase [Rhizorhabdus wittichii DC-6]QTH23207.1 dihydrolipoamide acyltransferase [Rhizorhabdus wittichii]
MTTQVLLPKLGFSMSEGELSEWLVPDGAMVTEGQPLYALESEKSTQEVEAPASGRLRIIAAVGETYEVGAVLAEIV